MTVTSNDPKTFSDDTEDLFQYFRLLLSGNKCNTIHRTITQVSTSLMDGGSNSHMFTNITMFTYIIPVKYNIQIFNGRKSSTKRFGLVIVKISKTKQFILLWPSYYIPKNPQNTII